MRGHGASRQSLDGPPWGYRYTYEPWPAKSSRPSGGRYLLRYIERVLTLTLALTLILTLTLPLPLPLPLTRYIERAESDACAAEEDSPSLPRRIVLTEEGKDRVRGAPTPGGPLAAAQRAAEGAAEGAAGLVGAAQALFRFPMSQDEASTPEQQQLPSPPPSPPSHISQVQVGVGVGLGVRNGLSGQRASGRGSGGGIAAREHGAASTWLNDVVVETPYKQGDVVLEAQMHVRLTLTPTTKP